MVVGLTSDRENVVCFIIKTVHKVTLYMHLNHDQPFIFSTLWSALTNIIWTFQSFWSRNQVTMTSRTHSMTIYDMYILPILMTM